MTPDDIFDRQRLADLKRDAVAAWLGDLRDIIHGASKLATGADRTIDAVESVISVSAQKHGIALRQRTIRDMSSMEDKEITVTREISFHRLSMGRHFITLESDGGCFEDSIDDLEEALARIESRAEWTEHAIETRAAHCMAMRELAAKGTDAISICPIAIRLLDHVPDESFELYATQTRDVALTIESHAHDGRGMRHLSHPLLHRAIRNRTPTALLAGSYVEGSVAFGKVDFHLRNDRLGIVTQRHENGDLRYDTIFAEGDFPDAVLQGSSGRPLDEIANTPFTRGLGLMIENIEESRRGIAIRTDARRHEVMSVRQEEKS